MHGSWEVFLTFLKLGMISFGGPIAHIAYFHTEFVKKKLWIKEDLFNELLAVCQMLPGPASSQMGISIGTIRAGWKGGILAWIGFTLPSALLLFVFAILVKSNAIPDLKWVHGLKLVACAVIAQAVCSMWGNSVKDLKGIVLCLAAAFVSVFFRNVYSQILVILVSAFLGFFFMERKIDPKDLGAGQSSSSLGFIPTQKALVCLLTFFFLLILLPFMDFLYKDPLLQLADGFYRSGALVFGGGHVVLPLLEGETVQKGILSSEVFLVGYGAAQAVPGPMFTFATFLGGMIQGGKGAILATISIFLPSFLLVFGVFPFWQRIRMHPRVEAALTTIQPAVLGILLAALYDPVLVSTIRSGLDSMIVLVLFVLSFFFQVPSWIIVLVGIFSTFLS
ncbi:chromate efflux transporter [Leptospira langatensis]|uniref:Chromate efflux transporter n=1 Tax=Leptospira langatensis TaxID=2484983 RepID=A0A5F1ZTH9_9LEPT|nr:chromate efflux transporter [Leptospira langatensis]TGK02642.1 chromate efflux transporter [Leptospira langatensis]TGL40156.1 chromate efflux transporter [Leptospira langatensis]